MKVLSPLANMTMVIGEVDVEDGRLHIAAGDDSTMSADVFVSPGDARAFAKSLFARPGALLWVLTCLFRRDTDDAQAAPSRLDDPLNRPW